MTLLAANNTASICRIRLATDERWVRLTLSLGKPDAGNRLVIADHTPGAVAGHDEPASSYSPATWQGGVISGARYAFRSLAVPFQPIRLHEFSGQLGSDDLWAISAATALGVAQLLNRPATFPLDLQGWVMETESITEAPC